MSEGLELRTAHYNFEIRNPCRHSAKLMQIIAFADGLRRQRLLIILSWQRIKAHPSLELISTRMSGIAFRSDFTSPSRLLLQASWSNSKHNCPSKVRAPPAMKTPRRLTAWYFLQISFECGVGGAFPNLADAVSRAVELKSLPALNGASTVFEQR